ncbi:MAG: magnesium/cobalt transporter CorA [Nitrospinae bacterium]|nr:magnesium/cobalt transporter CorA [Nitrospinota bacterium]
MLHILALSKPGAQPQEIKADDLPAVLACTDAVFWVRCLTPTEADLSWLQETFALHPLTIEDCRNRNQRAKLDQYDGYFFMVIFAFLWEGEDVETTEIHSFLTPHCLITVEDYDSPSVAAVWQRMQVTPEVMGRGADFVLYSVADAVVDTFFTLLETLEETIDDIEERIFRRQAEPIQSLIFKRRSTLIAVRRGIGPMRDVFNTLLNRNLSVIRETHLVYFRDLYDHTVRIYELLEMERERLANSLEVNLSHISNTLSQVMKRLTAIATIFMPLTFLTGFFGMNFEHLPFRSPLMLGLAVGSMVVVPVAMWVWMKRAHWF